MSNEKFKPWIPRIAMLMLALAASIGVYRFNMMFFPWWGHLLPQVHLNSCTWASLLCAVV